MPGGAHEYISSLASLLRLADRARHTDDVVDAVLQRFDSVTSRKSAGAYLRVPMVLGLLDIDGPRCEVTDHGHDFLGRSGTAATDGLYALLVSRVTGVEELLDLLRERPRRIGLLHQEMNRLGFTWANQTQVRYRLRWLEAVGAVCREGRARPLYRLTNERASDDL